MNNITIYGRLVADPEQNMTTGGVNVCKFRVAVNRAHSKEKKADFFNCIAWRQLGDIVFKHFGKGKEIILRGSMENNQFTDKENNKRDYWEINVDQICFVGSKGESGSSETPTYAPSESGYEDLKDDDLPFLSDTK
jgi:single-strand DNA-binding protein